MKQLCDEILSRFPEIGPLMSNGDEELPYLLMGYIADWLGSIGSSGFSEDIIHRVTSFSDWCGAQPEGKSAEDDIHTIFIVGFYETLFQSKSTRAFIPHLMSKPEVLANRDYLIQWVGEDEFLDVLKKFK